MNPSNVSQNAVNLDIGAFFTVQRGYLTQPAMEFPLPPDGEHTASQPAQYDRGWDGAVFEVLYQEMDFVACKVVFPAPIAGQTAHINIGELEIMPLSKAYVEALKSGLQFKFPPNPPGLANPLSALFAKSIDGINRAAGNDVQFP